MSRRGGGQTTPLFKVLKVLLELYYCTKHAYIVLGFISYVFNRGLMPPQANFLRKTMHVSDLKCELCVSKR